MFYYKEYPPTHEALRSGCPGRGRRLRCFDCGAEPAMEEHIFAWEVRGQNGVMDRIICADCFDERISELSRAELSGRIGVESLTVRQYLDAGTVI